MAVLALSCREERAHPRPAETPDASPSALAAQKPVAARRETQGSETPFTVQCRSETLRGSTGAGWTRDAAITDEYPARWLLATQSGAPAWAWVQCLPPRRTGLAEIDALYRRWRKPDGSLLGEVGTGYSGISVIDTMRTLHVESGGVLAPQLPPLTRRGKPEPHELTNASERQAQWGQPAATGAGRAFDPVRRGLREVIVEGLAESSSRAPSLAATSVLTYRASASRVAPGSSPSAGTPGSSAGAPVDHECSSRAASTLRGRP